MNERELLVDCVGRLNRTGIAYYLTGSMASNYWGIPRTTHDLDFVVQLGPSSVSRVIEEFTSDFYIDESAVRAIFQPPHQFNAIDTRSALKVDFWLPRPDPFDKEIFRRRLSVTLFDISTWISTAEDVIRHKLFWDCITASERQLGDAAGIVAVQGEALDKDYLRSWAQELGVANNLERLLSGEIRPKQT